MASPLRDYEALEANEHGRAALVEMPSGSSSPTVPRVVAKLLLATGLASAAALALQWSVARVGRSGAESSRLAALTGLDAEAAELPACAWDSSDTSCQAFQLGLGFLVGPLGVSTCPEGYAPIRKNHYCRAALVFSQMDILWTGNDMTEGAVCHWCGKCSPQQFRISAPPPGSKIICGEVRSAVPKWPADAEPTQQQGGAQVVVAGPTGGAATTSAGGAQNATDDVKSTTIMPSNSTIAPTDTAAPATKDLLGQPTKITESTQAPNASLIAQAANITTTEEPYTTTVTDMSSDCKKGYWITWSKAKKRACCKQHKVFCEEVVKKLREKRRAAQEAQAAGSSGNATASTAAPTIPAPPTLPTTTVATTTQTYDCSACPWSYWTVEKQKYCCEKDQAACEQKKRETSAVPTGMPSELSAGCALPATTSQKPPAAPPLQTAVSKAPALPTTSKAPAKPAKPARAPNLQVGTTTPPALPAALSLSAATTSAGEF